MARFILRRLGLSLITLLIILVIVTLIPNIAPGDPARKIAGGTASPERLMSVRESLGLDDSVAEQLSNLFVSVFTLDFGDSFTKPGESVMGLVTSSLWTSGKLVLFALVLVSFFWHVLAQFWPPAGTFGWLGVLYYYRPHEILQGDGAPLLNVAALVALGVGLWTAAGAVLARRDICTV